MPKAYDFNEQLRWSAGFLNSGIADILASHFPSFVSVAKADKRDDKSGADYLVKRDGFPDLRVDVKVRSCDYAVLHGQDDVALETWSVLGQSVGWTRDTKKSTDYVLWYWTDTGRYFLVSFPALCTTFMRHWQEWRLRYKTCIQNSGTWKSECTFVPRGVVVSALTAWGEGMAEVTSGISTHEN